MRDKELKETKIGSKILIQRKKIRSKPSFRSTEKENKKISFNNKKKFKFEKKFKL